MRPAGKMALFGIGIGLLFVISGYSVSRFYASYQGQLIDECKNGLAVLKQDLPAETAAHAGQISRGETEWEPPEAKAERCDPESLRQNKDQRLSALQGKILQANSLIAELEIITLPFSVGLPIVFSLPFLWHFLLARIRELREAMTGR